VCDPSHCGDTIRAWLRQATTFYFSAFKPEPRRELYKLGQEGTVAQIADLTCHGLTDAMEMATTTADGDMIWV
jgi:hypothetical protein